MLDKESMRLALEEIELLRTQLLTVREGMDKRHPRYQSLLNLRHYRLIRSKNRTRLQERLFKLSLSSLGRSYAHVAASIDTLYDQLSSSLRCEEISEEEMSAFRHLSIHDSLVTVSQNNQLLFGGKVHSRLSKQSTSVMVTLPSHAADDDGRVIRGHADSGVKVFRINTAHDSAQTWRAMADVIADINKSRDEIDKIKIFADLAGPKIRTGSIRRLDLPVVMGSNKRQKEVIICTGKEASTRPQTTDVVTLKKIPAQIAVDKKFFKRVTADALVKLIDTNGKKVFIGISKLTDTYATGLLEKKAYVDKDARLHRKRHQGDIVNIEKQIDEIRLFIGDVLIITEREVLGRSSVLDTHDEVIEPARINCSLKGIASYIKVGEKVFIDDGKIGLEVIEISDDSIICKVTHAKVNGTLLKEEKGINFPETHIDTPALTETDRENLLTVLEFVDHLSLSFCQDAGDVRDIQEALTHSGRSDIGIIAKIETKEAISNMPEILEQLLVWEKSGVMIARGDLAIEVGFKNMASVQEALLDICDAAHMPVIWATQVLESQMKKNLPSRAEITDAAMSGRADCVMLNKGAFAKDTIDVLMHILDDMHSLFKKNRQLLKKEVLW